MGQEPLNPPSVKGWDGGPAWINTSTLLARFNFVNALVAQTAPGKERQPRCRRPNVCARRHRAARRNGPTAASRPLLVSGDRAGRRDLGRARDADLVPELGDAERAGTQNPLPFGPENYQEKIRGAVALTLNLPVNQLD
jgi:hypothetical protein